MVQQKWVKSRVPLVTRDVLVPRPTVLIEDRIMQAQKTHGIVNMMLYGKVRLISTTI